MKKITFYLVLALFIFLSCKKTNETNIYYSNNSQLWINVDNSVPEFKLTFTSEDNKSNVFTYVVSYSNDVLNPTLRSKVVLNKGVYETWVLVHNNFDRSDQIVVKTPDGKEYKTTGFEFQEKRLLYIKKNISGVVNITDADITIIETVVYVD
jgi:hypothetical protein